jgi:hypothetical protein
MPGNRGLGTSSDDDRDHDEGRTLSNLGYPAYNHPAVSPKVK